MKFLLLLGIPVLAFFAWRTVTPGKLQVEVTERVLVPHVARFGVNLGNWTSWGAEQLASNVLKNPGFEGIVDRAIVIPQHSENGSFDDSPDWLARADSFWDGARYDVRTGPLAGKQGVVAHSMKGRVFGLPTFVVKDADELPDPGEVVSMTKESSDELPTQWWFSGPSTSFSAAQGQVRPGSPGTRSLRVTGVAGSGAEVDSYLDAIGQRAGNLLPLDGNWSLSFWTRLEKGNGNLRVSFGRDGVSPLLQKNVPLSGAWTNVRFTFPGIDQKSTGNVSLRFQVSGEPIAQVLLDDVDLRKTDDGDFPFRHEVVSVLESLHPQYLRDWEGQLGDTLANRIAAPFARKAYRYRPGDATQTDYGYGLRDFLDLCRKVHADPWLIVPTTFSDEECSGLGGYLKSQPDVSAFHEIVIEYGNENWNELFRPAGIPEARLHGQAAGRCMANVRQHSAGLPIKLTINAQHANPSAAADFAEESQFADMEAVAPYFLPSLDKNTSSTEALRALFSGDEGRMKRIADKMQELHKELAVYEVNVTTNGGSAPGDERNPIVAGAASGSALAKTMLDALKYGVRRQCVYTLAGYDAQLPNNEGYVKIWGITRDLGPTKRLRPTGLALELVNRVLAGDMQEIKARGPKDVSAYAFRSKNGWAVALISASGKTQQIDVTFPDSGSNPMPSQRLSLTSAAWDSTNEDSESVRIAPKDLRSEGRKISLDVAPWEFTVLLPGGGTN